MTEIPEDSPACSLSDIGLEISGPDAGKATASLNEYFGQFLKPLRKDSSGMLTSSLLCRSCNKGLDGFLGTFSWGMIHGHGRCSCGWPCVAYHWPKHDGEDLFEDRISIILQVHPKHVAKKDHVR